MTVQTPRKDKAIHVRVTESEGERLERIAQIEGRSVAGLARRALRLAYPQAFDLPVDGTNSADMEQNDGNTDGAPSGNTLSNGGVA